MNLHKILESALKNKISHIVFAGLFSLAVEGKSFGDSPKNIDKPQKLEVALEEERVGAKSSICEDMIKHFAEDYQVNQLKEFVKWFQEKAYSSEMGIKKAVREFRKDIFLTHIISILDQYYGKYFSTIIDESNNNYPPYRLVSLTGDAINSINTPRNDFEKKALDYFNKNPKEDFFTETIQGIKLQKNYERHYPQREFYLIAKRLKKETIVRACYSCHESPPYGFWVFVVGKDRE